MEMGLQRGPDIWASKLLIGAPTVGNGVLNFEKGLYTWDKPPNFGKRPPNFGNGPPNS